MLQNKSFAFSLTLFLCLSNRGKGDYFRLGHGTDVHVRKPQMVEGLRGKKIVHVAVGALHCLAVTETGQVCTDLQLQAAKHRHTQFRLTPLLPWHRSRGAGIFSLLEWTPQASVTIILSLGTNLIMFAHQSQ